MSCMLTRCNPIVQWLVRYVAVPTKRYPRMLKFDPVSLKSFDMSLPRRSLCPLIVTKSGDQTSLTTAYTKRDQPTVIRGYGSLLLDMCKVVPDGIVCFFVSYV